MQYVPTYTYMKTSLQYRVIKFQLLQMAQFRQLSSGGDVMVDNFRHVQKLGMRRVYVRRQPSEYSPLMAAQWNQTLEKLWNEV